MSPIFLGQLAIPVVLAAWMVVRPPRSAVGIASQSAGSLLALGALALVGVWLFPPWWVPHVAAAIVIVAALRALRARRSAGRGVLPQSGLAWTGVALFTGLGAFGAVTVVKARMAARMPNEPPGVDLSFPLPAGRYLVVNGGAAVLLNAHAASMDSTILRLRPWRGNGHAVDLVATNAIGVRAPGVLPAEPAAYQIFGVPVIAPCSGWIVAVVDGLPDMPVPEHDRANLAGNHVILDCSGVHLVLAHLRQGTVRVAEGDRVETGTILGAVGNSGGTDEPHLHMQAQRPGPLGSPLGGDPLPMRIGGRYLVRGDRVRIPSDRGLE